MKMILLFLLIFLLSGLNAIEEDITGIKDEESNFQLLLEKYQEKWTDNTSEIFLKRNKRSYRFFSQNVAPGNVTGCNECGMVNMIPVKKVISGFDVIPPYKYPWMVALIFNGKIDCGGAIIHEYYILTAAHCLMNLNDMPPTYLTPREVTVAFVTDTADVQNGPPVEALLTHPEFNLETVRHDIALIKLSHGINCNHQFKIPICLPAANLKVSFDSVFTIAGWGRNYKNSEGFEVLQEADVKIVPCTGKLAMGADNYYCLKGVKQETPCHGDSGGPMFARIGDAYHIFGVSSEHSSESCEPGHTFTYTVVPHHLDWIHRVIENRSPESFGFFPKSSSILANYLKNDSQPINLTRSNGTNSLIHILDKKNQGKIFLFFPIFQGNNTMSINIVG